MSARPVLTCAKCGSELPVHHFPGAHPEWQAVFTWRDGVRVCADPCVTVSAPQPINPPSAETGD
jgi:hypothetical protein